MNMIFAIRRDTYAHILNKFSIYLIKPNNIGEYLKGFQNKLWKEAFWGQYDNSNNINLLSDPTHIKCLPYKFFTHINN